jgi:Domain of unknown function (DUF4304)
MTAIKHLNSAKQCIARRMKLEGFSASGNVLSRKVNDTLVIVHIQADRHNTANQARLTINLGISLNSLRVLAASEVGMSDDEVPPIEKCHWRTRLGRLLAQQSDVWWAAQDELSARTVCEEVVAGLVEIALPIVYEAASSEALIYQWQLGHDNGLTTYERLASLARLLCVLNRIEDTKSAVQALEDASIGTSWEVSARCDVKVLRAQLSQLEEKPRVTS